MQRDEFLSYNRDLKEKLGLGRLIQAPLVFIDFVQSRYLMQFLNDILPSALQVIHLEKCALTLGW